MVFLAAEVSLSPRGQCMQEAIKPSLGIINWHWFPARSFQVLGNFLSKTVQSLLVQLGLGLAPNMAACFNH